MRDFTLAAYMSIVDALSRADLPVFGIGKWLDQMPARGVCIRHDVDRRPHNALRMAEAEAEAGIATTYYFRVVGSAYNKPIMRAVQDLGHEVGYHYEDLASCGGDVDRALAAFARHLADLRKTVTVRTIAMHGSPLSKVNNLTMWNHAQISDHGLIGEAFLTVDYADMYYFTDTGRSWGAIAANLRDRPAGIKLPQSPVLSSNDLCRFISDQQPQRLALSAHPERWDSQTLNWLMQGTKDQLINAVKIAVSAFR